MNAILPDPPARVTREGAISVFGPDFPFAYDDWIAHPAGLGELPAGELGTPVAIIGAGVAGMVAAHELAKLGLRPIVYEAGRIGGRLRSERFDGPGSPVAELGGMRFPRSATTFSHYADLLGLERRAFPNPLTEAAGTTVVDLAGTSRLARTIDDLPLAFREMAAAWDEALRTGAAFDELQAAMRARDPAAIKAAWDPLVHEWDDRTFYDFIATSPAFKRLSFRHREIFGQVGFGTGGWDSDFRNTMLEILRVVLTECDDNQDYIVGGAERMPRGLWEAAPTCRHWPAGTSPKSLNGGATRAGVARLVRLDANRIAVTDRYGTTDVYPGGARHLPELAADDRHRHRRVLVQPGPLDGDGPHELHAVVEDLRHGRPPVLEGHRSAHRRPGHEHDADRSADPRHLPLRGRGETTRPRSCACPTRG